jgi:hypothetical protein
MILIFNLLTLDLHKELFKGLLLLNQSYSQMLSLLLNHSQLLIVIWKEMLKKDLLYFNPCLVFVNKGGIKESGCSQIVIIEIEMLV